MRRVLMVGGGRWAHVLAEELAGLGAPVTDWVSARNAAGVRSDARVWSDLADCLAAVTPDIAVVANLPADHVPTAVQLLRGGIPTLVEKPVATSAAELRQLLAAAGTTPVAAGLEFLTNGHVRSFAAGLDDAIASVELVWEDPTRTQPSHFDRTTDVVRDLAPHLLSILAVVVGPGRITDEVVTTTAGGWSAALGFRYGGVPVTARLARDTAARRRELVVHDASGPTHQLDLTTLPSPSPLAEELADFLAMVDHGVDRPISLRATAPLHEDVERLAVAAATARLAEAATTSDPTELGRALAPELLAGLIDAGLVPHARDHDAADRWLHAAAAVIRTLAADPFAPQSTLGIDAEPLRTLNRVLRQSTAAQSLIVDAGAGAKYWTNTVIPLVRSGAVDRTLRGEPGLPFRIGVYPGASCMFFCTFCGRNPEARYDRHDLPAGNERFRRLLEDAPVDDPHRFYLSGGLEPLTNPGLGELVAAGADRGFALSLYTNGQMLTPTLLARQPGLLRLATVRVSLYGVDEPSQHAVTGKPNSFRQVTANVLDFLRLRDDGRTDAGFGLNYVVLPGRVDDVLRLLDLVSDLNRQVDRPLDFVTLREDFSVDPAAGITGAERERLATLFATVEARRTDDPDLAGVTIDYGYALDALRRGLAPTPLRYVADDEVRPMAFPQVSVVVDLLGDVYLYREAGFLHRPGARRYCIGRITEERSLDDVVAAYLAAGVAPVAEPGDTRFFDIFDHVVTRVLNQAEADAAFGIPFADGPVATRVGVALAHPTLATS